jgi:polyhydroxyalkanoate synthase
MSNNSLANAALKGALTANQRLTKTAANGMDWLFRRDTLIKSGRTWYELVYDGDPMAVRYYNLPNETDIELADGSLMPIKRDQYKIPLVLVPPLGATTETFDLMPQRSLVRYMAAAGFKTYMVDWGKPTKKHAALDLRSYSYEMMSTALEAIREHSGSKDVSMMGWCMGGLLSLMYQAQTSDRHVRNIVTVASPIDMRAGGALAAIGQVLEGPAKLIRNFSEFRLNKIDPALMQMPAWTTSLAFKLTAPVSSVTTYWDLLTGIADREFVEKHSTTADYLDNFELYPAGVIRDMTVEALVDNKFATGKIELRGVVVELNKVKVPLLAFAGEKDNIVPADMAKQILEIVGSTEKTFKMAPGGHMGVILGSKAQSHVWKESAAWLAERQT